MGIKKKKKGMQKVAVSEETPNGKQNRRIPEKVGFLAPKRNSSSLSLYHLD